MEFLKTTYILFGSAGSGGTSDWFALYGYIVPMIVIFYFLLIRPQQKKQQQHKQMLDNLKRGDKVITTGGIYGTIEGITDTTVQLKIANTVKIKILRSGIAGLQSAGETEETE